LGFLEKLAVPNGEVGAEDIEEMRAAGVSDQAIKDAIYVCFCFNVLSRLADAFDFELHTEAILKFASRFMYKLGYGRASVPG
jgi:hypothetical protein